MRTLHVGLRVSDLERSLAFYTALGYLVLGTVKGTPFGSLTMLRLPDDDFVTLELVHDPAKGAVELGTGIKPTAPSQANPAPPAEPSSIAPTPDPRPASRRTRQPAQPAGAT